MKKYLKISLVALIFLPSCLFGQSGYFENNPIWKVNSGCALSSCFGPICMENRDYYYYLNGDTTLNGHSYKKLFTKGKDYFVWNNSLPAPPCCKGGFIFHDSINPVAFLRDTLKSIYILDNLGNPEVLLYDFNLSIGDSLPITYNNLDSAITVISIDSVPISNFYRKRFGLSSNAIPHYLIEGIGHERGLLETMNPVLECAWNLACYGLGDSSYFPTFGSKCDNAVGIMEQEKFTSQVNIFPNPFDVKLNITSNELVQSEIIIYDVFSRKLFQQTFIQFASCNTANFTKGIYIYEVWKKNGLVNKGFVVKD